MKTILFSGRFDPPHPGHFETIIKLAEKNGAVRVVILDYPERRFTAEECLDAFLRIFRVIPLKITFQINDIHFAKITREEIEMFRPFDVYAAGNKEVLTHINTLGIPTTNIKRSSFYSATDYLPA